MKLFFLLAVMTLIMPAHYCFAGAWTEPKGHVYEKASLSYYTVDKFNEVSIANYLEYGLTNDISAINSIYYKFLRSRYSSTVYDNNSASGGFVTTNTTATAQGFGDFDLGLKQKLLDNDYGVFSHKLKVKIPGPYDKNDALPLGNGTFDLDYRALYGYSLWRWFPGYVNFEAGYRYRFGGLSDQFLYAAEIGTDLTDRIHARLTMDGTVGLNNGNSVSKSLNPTTEKETGKTVAACGGNGSYSSPDSTTNDHYDQERVTLALEYGLTKDLGLQIAYSPTLHASNSSEGTSYSVGLYYILK